MTFCQLQLSYKFGWDKKYIVLILLSSIPATFIYMKTIKYFIDGFDGLIWPSRLIGFGVGMFVFTLMSLIVFKEPLTLKTIISLILAILIILTQLLMK